MKIKFDVTPNELIIIKDILEKYLQKDCKSWVFGSRAKSSSLVGSDLDLALECKEKIDFKLVSKIKIAFEDARLPYSVDVVDMNVVKPYFKEIIDKEKIPFPLNIKDKIPELRFSEFSGEWDETKLGDISNNIMYGMNSSAIKYDGNHKYIRITDINESSRNFLPNPLTSPDGEIEEKFKLKENDILFTRTGASVGKSYIYKQSDGNLYFAGFLIKFNVDKADSKFIFLYTLKDIYIQWVSVMSVRSGQPGINAEEYKLLPIKLPQKQEQEKIASFLSSVDTKIEQLTSKDKLLQEYKKGVMQKIFSQEIRFKDDDGSKYPAWVEKELGDVTSCLDNKRKPLNGIERNSMKGSIPYYGANGIVDYINDYLFEEELVLLAEDGGNFNEFSSKPIAQKIDGKTWVNNHAHILKADKQISTDFLFFSLVHKDIRKYIVGGSRVKLNKSDLLSIKINLPTLKEQTNIANFLSSIDSKIEQAQKQLDSTKEFKKALLQQMFV